MAVKRYDGTAWQVVAGKGDQGTSSSISTWVKTASGGETSVSGNDDNSQPLSYTVGQELVFINGVLQKRGDDYTATTGNSITGLTALTAGDIVSVWTVNAFSVTNAISNTIVDAKGDILVGTGADTPGRLAVGTNGQVLTAASTTGTGLAWTTLPSGGKILQVVEGTTTTEVSNSTSTLTDTGLTATITPSSTSSKVLVFANILGANKSNGNLNNQLHLALLRGATTIRSVLGLYTSTTLQLSVPSAQLVALDSPATTSATTYKVQFANYNNTASVTVQNVSSFIEAKSTIILMEVGA
jgi:hypothetical protein